LHNNLYGDSYPGGAWAESLSYSSYFFDVAANARKLREAGLADPFRQWPRLKEVTHYLAAMHTPVDPRYGTRQKAPVGDTSPGNYVDRLRQMADDFRGIDDRFAGQLARFPDQGEDLLDLSSREFPGFGAMLRGNAYDERHESFVTVKAGPARNHFQGDELSFYFAGLGRPLAIDYACHYSPRPWSASMHNGLRPVAVAQPRAFAASPVADVFVADERTWRINHVPMVPHETVKPGWEYPTTILPEATPWTMRRYAMLVKHDPDKSRIADYLVIRDEIDSPQPVWQNLHVLARAIEEKGRGTYFFPGQLDVDVTLHVFGPTERIENRQWGWRGSSRDRRTLRGNEYEAKCFGAVVPESFERGTWGANGHGGGEMAKWLRLKGPAGTSRWLMLLMPQLKGRPAPQVEQLSETSVQVSLGGEHETVHLGSDGRWQAALEGDSRQTVLLQRGQVKAWSELEFKQYPPGAERGKSSR
jgi:hypothetical protein